MDRDIAWLGKYQQAPTVSLSIRVDFRGGRSLACLRLDWLEWDDLVWDGRMGRDGSLSVFFFFFPALDLRSCSEGILRDGPP
ncbi:hypothetical protein VTL71DRAFT_16428 [Oculimacula yallundae]|uniref:Uncharacterized protein n=1 Tax=Oculimacula yallundae TaxID=86028 RepID=A0ABR4CEF7_9HELO